MHIKVISGIFLNVYVALPTPFCGGTDGIEDICTFEISRSDTHSQLEINILEEGKSPGEPSMSQASSAAVWEILAILLFIIQNTHFCSFRLKTSLIICIF